jgi:cysteine desulfurase
MDHSATTAVDPRVVEAMLPYFTERYGNPSSVYALGAEAKAALDAARLKVAELIGALPREILFTSCGTESDNLALRGVAFADRHRGRRLITTPIEHHAITHTCDQLAREFGFEVTYVPVDEHGVVNPDDVGRAITPETTLISVMAANNEVGTLEPLAEIGKIARARGIAFHTDAVQAAGQVPIDVDDWQVDLLSLSGHKFYAPKGVGVLYVREGTRLLPMQTGGGQEMHRRAGTENVPYIVGFARALELAHEMLTEEAPRLRYLRDRLIEGVLRAIPDAYLTGHPTKRLPGHASFVFDGVDGEAVLLHLGMTGVAASTGSACASGESEPSPVLVAMTIEGRRALGSLRLSLGRENTAQDVDDVLRLLPPIIAKLRALSPLYGGATFR